MELNQTRSSTVLGPGGPSMTYPTMSAAELEPGDVILFNGDTLFAQLVQYFDHTDFFHAAIMTSKTTLAEAVMADCVAAKALSESYAGRTWAVAFRYLDTPASLGPVVTCAQQAVEQHRYAYEDLPALALLCLSRRVPQTASFFPLLACLLAKAASATVRAVAKNEPLVCSGFVEFCFRRASPEGRYPLRIMSHDGLESLAERRAEEGSVLAEMERYAAELERSSGFEGVTGVPPADQLEALAKAYINEAKQPGADRVAGLEAVNYVRLIDPVMRLADRLLGARSAEDAPRRLSDSVRELRRLASSLVTPGDLARSPSFRMMGRLPEGGLAPWDEAKLGALEEAVRTFDRKAAEALCDDLIGWVRAGYGLLPVPQAKKVLQLLRRKRYFALMQAVADAILLSGQRAAAVRRQYAQALIEQGELSAALYVLQALKVECREDGAEIAEASGLIGRVYKKLYLAQPPPGESQRRTFMNEAIRAYHAVYEGSTEHRWHGINAAALLARAKRDGVPVETEADARRIATDILTALSAKAPSDVSAWDAATAAEACIALEREDDALAWLRTYVNSPDADAFELATTLRQFQEVWGLREDAKNGELVSILKAALLRRDGSGLQMSGPEIQNSMTASEGQRAAFDAVGQERVFGGRYVLYEWFRCGLQRAAAVGRVEDRFGRGLGSGILVRADLVGHGDGWVFLTNSHVVPGALQPEDAFVRFEAGGPGSRPVQVAKLLWESPPGPLGFPTGKLDTSILRLKEDGMGDPDLTLAPPDEPLHRLGCTRRLYIIGYPHGATLAISIDDNAQVGWQRPLLHYRTPTEPGSSGSPIFDDQWRLIGIHHGGLDDMPRLDGQQGAYQANEGIWIHAIVRQGQP